MKTTTLLLAIGILFIVSCNNDCLPGPLNNDDIAGYIDGSTGILFTTETDKQDVLTKLDASPHEGSLYKMPVFEIENQPVYLLFEIAEVEKPGEFINYQHSDYCFQELFIDFENELMDIIERNEANLEDQFIIACGDVIGQIGEEEEAKENIRRGKEKEALDKIKEKKENKKKLKKELAETAKKKGQEAKEALNNGDKDGAKEKAKELKEETKFKYYEYFKWEWCPDLDLGLKYGYYYLDLSDTVLPELINDFSKDNIRYKVYKSAKCGDSYTPPYITCWKWLSLDTIRPAPAVWNTVEQLPRKNCERGTAFCVEQEVVIALDRDYSDSLCSRLINVRPIKGFACFD